MSIYYDLPPRGIKERVILRFVKRRLEKGDVATPPDYDWFTNGFPMPYGIDVSPVDGSVWVGQLDADDIAHIEPATGKVNMIKTTFSAPRRPRCDADGNVWIVSFSSGKIASYDPRQKKFTIFDLPLDSERDLLFLPTSARSPGNTTTPARRRKPRLTKRARKCGGRPAP